MSEKKQYKKQVNVVCRGCTIGERALLWESFVSSCKNDDGNSYLTLVPEPNNRYDKNAVKVMCKGEMFGTLGYIGREYAEEVGKIIKDNKNSHRVDMTDKKEAGNKEIKLIISYDK